MTERPDHLDFITALSIEDCIRTLKGCARQADTQRLKVRIDGRRIWVESAGEAPRHGRTPTWLFRFEGSLTPTPAGTHVHGAVVRNRQLENGLAVMGIAAVAFGTLGIAYTLAAPGAGEFILLLALPLLALFATYYLNYRRLLRQQVHDLARWLYEWLTLP